MKSITLLATAILLSLGLSAQAESTLTLNGIHNCCKGCENGITKAITKVDGATAAVTKTSVTITAKSKSDLDKAVDSLLDAGYYGEGATVKAVADKQVKTATVSHTHLCCGKCVKGVDEAIKNVNGATKHNATKGEDSFTVEGDFNLTDLQTALNKAGYNGKIE
ncbi:hypothetical protein [Verrucomicrobium spinosum]|uniref:hypothetical protein n=1 Tax=Verrucomicrobium spinosum TaxID=2736 RepID=UPI0001744D7A|nr:hypothetical protein [Verrucomicrobium spinosum]